ncbi:MAG: hypothetical protein ACTSPY_05405 [Candidatus Helarchaeota archaeon]
MSMNNIQVQGILNEYYLELVEKETLSTVPNCPICKRKMKFEKYEPFFTTNKCGYLRRFKCDNHLDREIKLWRK